MAVTRATAPELTTEEVARILVTPREETSQFLAADRPRISARPVRLPGTQSVAVDGALTLDHLIDAWGKALSENRKLAHLFSRS